MKIALVSVACLALLQLLLAMNISFLRLTLRVSHSSPDDPDNPLYRAVVAHRNACEFVPLLCILILLPQLSGGPYWSLWLGPAAVLIRALHAFGILNFSLRRGNLLRQIGAGGSYLIGLLLVGVLLWGAATH